MCASHKSRNEHQTDTRCKTRSRSRSLDRQIVRHNKNEFKEEINNVKVFKDNTIKKYRDCKDEIKYETREDAYEQRQSRREYSTIRENHLVRNEHSNRHNQEQTHTNAQEIPPIPKSPEKPNFEPSGLLLEETNTKNGVVLKYTEPQDARAPEDRWRLYVFKSDDSEKETKILHLHRHSYFIVGKEPRVAEILLVHPTISKQHAAIQFRHRSGVVLPYLIDLNSTNGSFINGERIEPCRYYEIRHGDSFKFGKSSRDLILVNEGAADNKTISYSEFVTRTIDIEDTQQYNKKNE